MKFPCTACGACCRQLPEASPFRRVDGACRHLDAATQRCSIYAVRPLVCRVDDLYEQRLAADMTPRVFYLLQAKACVALDPGNASLPAAMADLLAAEAGCAVSASLSDAEIEEGLRQIMAVAMPLMTSGCAGT